MRKNAIRSDAIVASVRHISSLLAAVLCTGLCASHASAAVGRTAGSFSVTQDGAATYTIPIFTPPGPRGMQPSIALAYNSTSGIGPLGKGWSISGLSAITRCNKTIAEDGSDSPIQLQTTDGYCLNGNRLRLYTGTYGVAGSTYQTELADFSLVSAVGTAGNGPASFTVQGKDGLTYDYGTDSTSQVLATGTSTASQWMLREIRDRSNNRVRFTYATTGAGLTGVTHPVTIEWTATTSGGSTFLYSMAFSYISNAPASSPASQVAGTAVTDAYLLNYISVSSNGSVVRKYQLGYNTSPSSGAYRLHTVTECSDSAESDCLAPTTIAYQDTVAGVINTGYTGTIPSNDLNGDGYPEAVTLAGTTFTITWGGPSGGTNTLGPISGLGAKYLIGDVTGTGKASILTQQSGVWWAYTWNGSSFSSVNTGISVASSTTYYLADADGDGRKDLFAAPYSNPNGNHYSYGTITYRLSTGSNSGVSFSSTTTTAINLSGLFSGTAYASVGVLYSSTQTAGRYNTIDFNGDAREDMGLTVWTVNCTNPPGPYTCLVGFPPYTRHRG